MVPKVIPSNPPNVIPNNRPPHPVRDAPNVIPSEVRPKTIKEPTHSSAPTRNLPIISKYKSIRSRVLYKLRPRLAR
jgi:hypothetical protein